MNQNFKLKYDEMRENSSVNEKRQAGNSHYKIFDSFGHVRYLRFTWPDGRRKPLNYAYLMHMDCSADSSCIILYYTFGKVTLHGARLGMLLDDLESHLPKEVICIDARYNATVETTQFIVNSITIDTEK